MKESDPEPIRELKRSGNLLKWIYSNGAMNLSIIIMYSTVDLVINVLSSLLGP